MTAKWQRNDWTPETVERLKQLAAEGYSASAIGRALGMTRGAVLGKAHRLSASGARIRIGNGTTAPGPRQRNSHHPRPAGSRNKQPNTARRDLILTMVQAGKTHDEIAAMFGVSRPSVSHAVMRARRDGDPRAAIQRKPGPRPPQPMAMPIGPEPTEGTVAYPDDVRYGQCRWPMWGEGVLPADRLVCGRPVSGTTSWCAHHRLRVFTRRNYATPAVLTAEGAPA